MVRAEPTSSPGTATAGLHSCGAGGSLRAPRWASLLLLADGLDRRANYRFHLADHCDSWADHRHRLLISVPPDLEPDLGDVPWPPMALLLWW